MHTKQTHASIPPPAAKSSMKWQKHAGKQHMYILVLSRNQPSTCLFGHQIRANVCLVKKQQAVPANPSSSAGSLCFTFTALSNKMTYKCFGQTSCSNQVAFFSFAAACFLSQSLCACHSVWSNRWEIKPCQLRGSCRCLAYAHTE